MAENNEPNAIQVFRKSSLGSPTALWTIQSQPDLLGIIGRNFPGDMNTDKRAAKTRALIEQAIVHVANSGKALQPLLGCTGESYIQALGDTAALDLSLVKATGECYLIPFGHCCTHMTGYRGFIKLIINTGAVLHIETALIYLGESFRLWDDDTGQHWLHERDIALQGEAENVTGGYAVARMREGSDIIEPMNIAELRHVMSVSKMKDGGPNKQWTTEMYRKATIRRLAKGLVKTGDKAAVEILNRAVIQDNTLYNLEHIEEANATALEHSKEGLSLTQQPREQQQEPAKPQELADDGEPIPDTLSAEPQPESRYEGDAT